MDRERERVLELGGREGESVGARREGVLELGGWEKGGDKPCMSTKVFG